MQRLICFFRSVCKLISQWILFCFLFYLPFLSSIHEKANCIAILWTGSPHSLGSCLFRGLWATCLPHKGGGIPLSALPKDTTSELAGLFSTTSPKCRTPSREVADTIFKVFWYDSTRGMNPRSTDCEADAITTTPSDMQPKSTNLSTRLLSNLIRRRLKSQCFCMCIVGFFLRITLMSGLLLLVTGRALLMSPKGRNASRDGLV